MSHAEPPWVVKVGSEELVPGPSLGQFVLWAARQVRRGRQLIVVHGGGDEVTARATSLSIPTEKRAGQRVTSDAMLEVVAEVLAGRVNVRITNALQSAGVPSVGLTGVSGGMLPVRPAGSPAGSLGWVGEPEPARTRLLAKMLEEGLTPVVAPLGTDGRGGVYNVNADLAAGAIAASLAASLLLISDVEGVHGPNGSILSHLPRVDVELLLRSGAASDGMIPKLTAALRAAESGATAAWIGSLASLGDDPAHPHGGTYVGSPPPSVLPLLPTSGSGGT